MTIATEVQRIKDNIANTYMALGEKGAVIPETQNSANLADTVATITVGGGSGATATTYTNGWERPASFDFVNNIVKNFDGTNYEGFIVNKNYPLSYEQDVCIICGFVLQPTHSKVAISGSACKAYKVPENATIVQDDIDKLVIDYTTSDEKWLFFVSNVPHGPLQLDKYGNGTIGDYSYTQRYVAVKYFKDGIKSCTGTDLHRCIPYQVTEHSANFLEDLDFYNVVCSATLDFSYSPANKIFPRLKSHKKLYDLFNNGNNTYYGTVLTGSTAGDFVGYSLSGNSSPLAINCYDFPLVLDLSGVASGTTVYPCRGYNGSRCLFGVTVVKNLKLILNAESNYDFVTGWSYVYPVLSKEVIEFMAENAPTASGTRYLYIGAQNIANTIGAGSDAISVLQAKGWTVS